MRNPQDQSTQVELSIAAGVARICFQGPRGIQTLSESVRQQLLNILEELKNQPEVRLVLFQGTGRTFLAGADVHELLGLDADSAYRYSQAGQALMNRIAALPMLTVAVLNGACVGGGLELALACDLRVAQRQAKLGFPETGLGLLPAWGGTVRCTRLLGPLWAKRLVLTGELVQARQAVRWGLVDAVSTVLRWEEFLQEQQTQWLSRSPQGIREARRVIEQCVWSEEELKTRMAAESEAFVACVLSGHVDRGVQAFLEKTSAVW